MREGLSVTCAPANHARARLLSFQPQHKSYLPPAWVNCPMLVLSFWNLNELMARRDQGFLGEFYVNWKPVTVPVQKWRGCRENVGWKGDIGRMWNGKSLNTYSRSNGSLPINVGHFLPLTMTCSFHLTPQKQWQKRGEMRSKGKRVVLRREWGIDQNYRKNMFKVDQPTEWGWDSLTKDDWSKMLSHHASSHKSHTSSLANCHRIFSFFSLTFIS